MLPSIMERQTQNSAMLVLLCVFGLLKICMTTGAGQSVKPENSSASTPTFPFIPESSENTQVTGALLFTGESPKLRCNHELEEQVDIIHIMPITSIGNKIVINSTVNELFRGQFQIKDNPYYLDLIVLDRGTNVNGSNFQCIGRKHSSLTSLRTFVETPPCLNDINFTSEKEFEFSVVTSVGVDITIETPSSCHPIRHKQNGTHSIMHVQCKSEMNDLCPIFINASVGLSNQSSVETRYWVLGQVCDQQYSVINTMNNDQPKDGNTADKQDDPADNKTTNGKPQFLTALMTILVLMVIN